MSVIRFMDGIEWPEEWWISLWVLFLLARGVAEIFDWPILSYIANIGFVVWLIAFCVFFSWVNRRSKNFWLLVGGTVALAVLIGLIVRLIRVIS